MDAEQLIKNHPRLYHMAEKDAWLSIQKHGLLSTTALLDLFEIKGNQREALESAHRPESVTITHPTHGRAVVRDQKPMSDSGLRRCLSGVSPREWYQILNRKTFFWLTEERLHRLLSAGAYRAEGHCVLTVDTKALIIEHRDQITLSPINSGCTKPMPHPRDKGCFLRINDYDYAHWLKKRHKKDPVVEVAVDYSVPQIASMVLRVEILKAGGRPQVIFEK
jgi:hypothetical protein